MYKPQASERDWLSRRDMKKIVVDGFEKWDAELANQGAIQSTSGKCPVLKFFD